MIERYFTKDLPTMREEDLTCEVEDMFQWKTVDIELKDSEGNILYAQDDCLFPSHYSQTACDIIASKYFWRGKPERDLTEVVDRMTTTWRDALIEEGIFATEEEGDIFNDEVKYILYAQMWAPNSPQWFNTGVVRNYGAYGAKNDEGNFYLDIVDPIGEMMTMADEDNERAQTSACYILDIKDKLIGRSSITDHYVTETKLFKGGSGCGTNFSCIRAKDEPLSSGGTSSGLMSYLKGLDVNAGTIKSGGTTRRAAKMVIVDADHPEIEDFIKWKVKEEEKARVLIKAGYDSSIGGEAYSTVSGQNSNNSVRLPGDFWFLLDTDGDWNLTNRTDGKVRKTMKARELFHEIAEAAWACGDPGLIFSSTVNRYNTCAESGKINASNPCGEFMFLDNTACNLSSINLEKFITEDTIDLSGLRHVVTLAQLVMEASCYWGVYPTTEIAENSYKFRPTGLGITGLAGALENLGLAYDSQKARSYAAVLCSFITAVSYRTSAKMAEIVGPFKRYDENRKSMNHVMYQHLNALLDIDDCEDEQIKFIQSVARANWNEVVNVSGKHAGDYGGFRNAQVTCIAPTGTISLAMDASSTGVEPYYSRKVVKKLADGSKITKEIDCIKTADEIDPLDHVRMVAAIQPHISGAISKTVNMPHESTVEDVEGVFLKAWDLGCKSITIYRDGSKETQVLNDKDEDVGKIQGQLKPVDEEKNEPIKAEDIFYFKPRDPSFYVHEDGKWKKPPKSSTTCCIADNDENMIDIDVVTPTGTVRQTLTKEEDADICELIERQDDLKEEDRYLTEPFWVPMQGDGPERYTTWWQIRDAHKSLKEKAVEEAVSKYKKDRNKPNGIRRSTTHSAKIGDIQLYITVGFYDDGKMAELFVNTDRQGEVVTGLLASLSKAISHLLQYGVEPMQIAKMLRGQKYEPAGVVERHPNIKMADSISDLISKVIEFEEEDYRRIEVKTDEMCKNTCRKIMKEKRDAFADPRWDDYDENGVPYWAETDEDKKSWSELTRLIGSFKIKPILNGDEAKWLADKGPTCDTLQDQAFRAVNQDTLGLLDEEEPQRVYGEVCSNCGSSNLIRTGTCKTCPVCGTTTGCG